MHCKFPREKSRNYYIPDQSRNYYSPPELGIEAGVPTGSLLKPSAPPLPFFHMPVGPVQFAFPVKSNNLTVQKLLNDQEGAHAAGDNDDFLQFMGFPIIRQEFGPQPSFPQGGTNVNFMPVEYKVLKAFKEAISSYGMHSSYVTGLLNNFAIEHKLIPMDWETLARTVLEPGEYLQFKTWWKEEADHIA